MGQVIGRVTMRKVLSTAVSDETYKKVKDTADSMGVSMSRLIRLMIEQGLQNPDISAIELRESLRRIEDSLRKPANILPGYISSKSPSNADSAFTTYLKERYGSEGWGWTKPSE